MIDPEDLVVWQPPIKKEKPKESDSEDDVDLEKAVEQTAKQKKQVRQRVKDNSGTVNLSSTEHSLLFAF